MSSITFGFVLLRAKEKHLQGAHPGLQHRQPLGGPVAEGAEHLKDLDDAKKPRILLKKKEPIEGKCGCMQ